MASGRSLFPGFSRENLGNSGRAVWYVNNTTGDRYSRHTFETKIRKIPDSRIRSHPDKLTKQQVKAIAADKQRINTLKISAKTGTKPPKSIRDTLVRNAKKISPAKPKISEVQVPPKYPTKFTPILAIFEQEIKDFSKSRTRHTIVAFDDLKYIYDIVEQNTYKNYGVMLRYLTDYGEWKSTNVVYMIDRYLSNIVGDLLDMMTTLQLKYKASNDSLQNQIEQVSYKYELIFIADL